jgi:hypothetical protein
MSLDESELLSLVDGPLCAARARARELRELLMRAQPSGVFPLDGTSDGENHVLGPATRRARHRDAQLDGSRDTRIAAGDPRTR